MQNTETYNTLQKPEILFPTMKPTDVPAKAKALRRPGGEEGGGHRFSKVKIEPLFEEEVDFETFSKSDFPRSQGQGMPCRSQEQKAARIRFG